MGKQPARGRGKGSDQATGLDRRARIAHGEAVLRNVQARVEELGEKKWEGLLDQRKLVADKTRKKYEVEEISN